jgi:hypothetical protein
VISVLQARVLGRPLKELHRTLLGGLAEMRKAAPEAEGPAAPDQAPSGPEASPAQTAGKEDESAAQEGPPKAEPPPR